METFTWKIKQFVFDKNDGYISSVFYSLMIKEGEWRTTLAKSVALPRPSTLIPYDQVTEELAIGWVQEALGEDRIEAMKDSLRADLLTIKPSPDTNEGLPWEPAPEPAAAE